MPEFWKVERYVRNPYDGDPQKLIGKHEKVRFDMSGGKASIYGPRFGSIAGMAIIEEVATAGSMSEWLLRLDVFYDKDGTNLSRERWFLAPIERK